MLQWLKKAFGVDDDGAMGNAFDQLAQEHAATIEELRRTRKELDDARERTKQYELGGLVTGQYCAFCANSGEVGLRINGHTIYCCLKNTPCKHFQRREE